MTILDSRLRTPLVFIHTTPLASVAGLGCGALLLLCLCLGFPFAGTLDPSWRFDFTLEPVVDAPRPCRANALFASVIHLGQSPCPLGAPRRELHLGNQQFALCNLAARF